MKAPDKLVFNEALFSDIGIFGIEDETEYIRKDALLEWLIECKENPIISDLQKYNIQEVIDKIESL